MSNGDGTFTHAPELVDGQIEAHDARVLSADFNGDERNDLVVYDHGAYVDSESSGYGNPPQLFVSCPDGVLRPFGALADAVRAQHERQPPHLPPAAPADLHLKMATAGDLENDGDVDIWVESDGGNNMNSHFVVNNGDGSFTIDIRNRATDTVHHNSPPTWWRYHEALFMDVDQDGDSDLVLGQLRDPSRLDQFSIILVNDGSGYFPTRTELPHPHSTMESRGCSASPASTSIGTARTTCSCCTYATASKAAGRGAISRRCSTRATALSWTRPRRGCRATSASRR